jgi:hypothetical protein
MLYSYIMTAAFLSQYSVISPVIIRCRAVFP